MRTTKKRKSLLCSALVVAFLLSFHRYQPVNCNAWPSPYTNEERYFHDAQHEFSPSSPSKDPVRSILLGEKPKESSIDPHYMTTDYEVASYKSHYPTETLIGKISDKMHSSTLMLSTLPPLLLTILTFPLTLTLLFHIVQQLVVLQNSFIPTINQGSSERSESYQTPTIKGEIDNILLNLNTSRHNFTN